MVTKSGYSIFKDFFCNSQIQKNPRLMSVKNLNKYVHYSIIYTAPVTTEKCYLCSKEVAYGHKCFTCREVICKFPSCSTAHEEDDLASPAYFCKNCKKDEKRAPSCSGVKKTLLNFHSYKTKFNILNELCWCKIYGPVDSISRYDQIIMCNFWN